ncbi:unnamed protein product [Aphanomyces euteiches]
MNLLQIGSQSYQAFVMFNGLTRLGAILSYALLVVYCFLSPVTLFIHNPRVKTTLVNVEGAVFRVVLCGGHPLVSVAGHIVKYILLDPSMANDNAWATEALLTTRMLVPTSIFDLMAKLTMYITTMASLRRAMLDLCDGCCVDPSKFASKPPRRQLLKINAFLCGAWGVVLSVLIVQAIGFRMTCPSYCVTHARPMLDLSCQCIYTHVNCAQLGVDDPSPLLSADKLGTSLFYLEISRCALRDGLATETLAPFEQLNQITLLFSNMETWHGPLPSTVNTVDIRYSELTSIPNALAQDIPDSLATIQIEACSLGHVPDSVFEHWAKIDRLQLINVSLTSVPSGLFSLGIVQYVSLRMNQLSEIPWRLLAQQDVTIDLSGNPIPATAQVDDPSLIESRQVIVDGTPLCTSSKAPNCHAFCAPNCSVDSIGDRLCDLGCLTASCQYDRGDCELFGIQPALQSIPIP